MPQIFGWMVHVYPFEQKPEDIWSVERQAPVTWTEFLSGPLQTQNHRSPEN